MMNAVVRFLRRDFVARLRDELERIYLCVPDLVAVMAPSALATTPNLAARPVLAIK